MLKDWVSFVRENISQEDINRLEKKYEGLLTKKFKTIYIPKNILPEDEFTEMLKNFCHVYRINIDRNQLCFIYENELNKTTAHKIKYWELD